MIQITNQNKVVISSHEKISHRVVSVIACVKYSIICILGIWGIMVCTFAWSIEVTQGPSLIMDPNNITPLAGVAQFTTDVPTRATLSISNGVDSWVREFTDYETEHYIPILGLKPDSTYTIEVTVTDEEDDSIALSHLLEAVTGPLPDDFPNITVFHSDPARMEPGYTLLDLFVRAPARTSPQNVPDGTLSKYTMILDNAGEVVWYSTRGSRDMAQLANGNITYFTGGNLIEADLLGNTQRSTHLGGNLHHDRIITSNGTILSLTRTSVLVDGYPTSYSNPNEPTRSVAIVDNPVVEFSLDGSLLNTWRLTDLLDKTRIGYGSMALIPSGGLDWAHANAVDYNPSDDSIIVSVRNQDAIIKFSRTTGNLKWILANHNNWSEALQPYLLTPVGVPFEWHYHPHASMFTPSGTVLLFDNGNYRASPFDGREQLLGWENYSRAVEYEIDEDNMEVRQLWEYGAQAEQVYYTPSVGDADSMTKTGNVLITFGNTLYVDGVTGNDLGMGSSHTRIVEVDRNTPANKVFEVAIYNSTHRSWMLGYRSERIPDLYPLDTDEDGVPDYKDNCVLHANGPLIKDSGGNSQLDTDNDGFGNLCDADLNNDGQTNSLDLGLMKLAFFSNEEQPSFEHNADLNGDGVVNSLDLGIAKTLFFQSPGPSALAPL